MIVHRQAGGIMSIKRIRIETRVNMEYRDYHVNAVISAEEVWGGLAGADRNDPFRQLSLSGKARELTDDTKATIMRLYDIEGVTSVGLNTYEVTLSKSAAFEWSEIDPQVVTVLTELLQWQGCDVDVDHLFCGKVSGSPVTREQYEAEMERQRRQAEAYEDIH